MRLHCLIIQATVIENWFTSDFFSVVKMVMGDSSGVPPISKLWPLFQSGSSPLLNFTRAGTHDQHHGICGFAQRQVVDLARELLGLSWEVDRGKLSGIIRFMKRYFMDTTLALQTIQQAIPTRLVNNSSLGLEYLHNCKLEDCIVKP